MIRYLTPAQARTMRLGTDLTSVTDAQLAADIAAASLAVNNATLAPNLPSPHDFRGGSVVGESHTFWMAPYDTAARYSTRVFLYHRPVIEVTQLRIYVTDDQYLEFPDTDLYYEPSEGWVEPTSSQLSSYGLFGAAMLPFVGLEQPHWLADYSYGSLFPSTEPFYLTAVADVWRGQTAFWSADDVEVRVNGTPRAEADYTIDRTEGTITMINAAKPTEDDSVEVDFVGTLHPNIARATGLILAEQIVQANLSSSGMGGLNRIRVAEIEVQRNASTSHSGGTAVVTPTIPPAAADLLAEFVFMPLAFG